MSLKTNKAKTYLGFAIKSRSIVYGVDDICKTRKAELIIISSALSETSAKKIVSYSEKNNIILLKMGLENFQELIDNINVKAIAILDKNLADAIKMNLTNL